MFQQKTAEGNFLRRFLILKLLVSALNDVGEVENGQEHTDDHAANHDAEEHDEQRFDKGHEAGERGFNFLVEKVGDAFKHVVDIAGLFTGAQHADDHAGEDRMFSQRGGNAFTAFDVVRGGLDGFFHDGITNGLGNDLQNFKDRHAAADERGQCAGETGETNLVGDGTENGQANTSSIPEIAPLLGFDEIKPAPNHATGERTIRGWLGLLKATKATILPTRMMIYQAKNLAFTYKILFISELGESIIEKKCCQLPPFSLILKSNAPARCWGKLFLPRS